MYRTLLGEAGFRKGTDLYFDRHDGNLKPDPNPNPSPSPNPSPRP